MPRVNPEIETFARIKVLGCGGSGKNAVDHMIRSKVSGIDFVAINTDAQDLYHALAPQKVHIGKNVTRGLGAGMDPALGRQAAEENKNELQELARGVDMVFITGGFGGGTATGSAPVVAELARAEGALTVAVVTKPFLFEGVERMRIAEEGLLRLREAVDAMIIVPNEKILSIIEKKTSFGEAFAMCDEILRQAVQGISDLITLPGIINVDFADIRSILKNAGTALMGIGTATGEERAVEAAKAAINSPLLDVRIDGAHGVLFSVAGSDDMTMWEVNEAAKVITENIDKNAKVIFGAIRDEKLKKGTIKITVVASGFGDGYKEIPSQPKTESLFSKKETKSDEVSAPSRFPKPVSTRVDEPDEKEEEESADEWDAIPAFLRRTKK